MRVGYQEVSTTS